MTDLIQAIAELRRVTPPNSPWEAGDIGAGSSPVDYHIATTLNAVLSGDLIPKADADLAVAMMVEPLLKLREGIEADIRSAHHGRGNGSSSAMREDDRDFRAAVAAAFDALAPDAGTAALAKLRERAEKAEQERVAEWNRRRDADGSRNAARAACDTMRAERDARAELAQARAEAQAAVALGMERAAEILAVRADVLLVDAGADAELVRVLDASVAAIRTAATSLRTGEAG